MKNIFSFLSILFVLGCQNIPETGINSEKYLSPSELRTKYSAILPKMKKSYNGTPDDVSRAQCRGELVSLSLQCGTRELESEVTGGKGSVFIKAPHISCREYMDDYSNNRLDFACK